MSLKSSWCMVLFLILLFVAAGSSFAAKPQSRYWICYSEFYNRHAKFLMQIDSSGNILRQPKMLTLPFQFDSAASAIAMSHSGDGNILVWFAGKGGSIFRALINKQSMNVIEMSKTDLHTGLIRSFGTTQKRHDNFLALKTTGKGLRAFMMFSSGFPVFTRKNWPISPNEIGNNKQGSGRQQAGVSSDGKMSFWINTKSYVPKLYVQRLDENGKLLGTAKFIIAVYDSLEGTFGGVDVTNQLPSKRRFVVYAFGPEERGGSVPDHLFLQEIDSDTGEKIGQRITLYSATEDEFNSYSQNVAVDPFGRFVIFEDSNLFFQALDSTGQKKGARKKLVAGTTISGIDLLEEK